MGHSQPLGGQGPLSSVPLALPLTPRGTHCASGSPPSACRGWARLRAPSEPRGRRRAAATACDSITTPRRSARWPLTSSRRCSQQSEDTPLRCRRGEPAWPAGHACTPLPMGASCAKLPPHVPTLEPDAEQTRPRPTTTVWQTTSTGLTSESQPRLQIQPITCFLQPASQGWFSVSNEKSQKKNIV